MGVFGRLGKVAEGLVDMWTTPFGLGKDLITAPFRDDDIDGIINTIKTHATDRIGGQMLGGLFGPDTGVGALVGGLPEDQVREPANRVFEALEWVYGQGSERYATLVTTAQSGDLSIGGFRNARQRVTDTTLSPGQAVAATFTNTTIADDEELDELRDSIVGKSISGTVDGAMRLYFDPTVGIAKGIQVARVKGVVKPITEKTVADLDRVMGTSRIQKFNAALEGKNASQIRDQFFPNDVNGAALSATLFEAGDAKTRESVLRLAMGDSKELQKLYDERADIAGRMERLLTQDRLLRSLDEDNFARVNARTKPQMTLFDEDLTPSGDPLDAPNPLDEDFGAAARMDEMPSELERTELELNALYSAEERLARRDQVFGQMRNQPRARVIDKARVSITRSNVYQKNVMAAPVAQVFNMRPNLLLDLNDPAGDANVTNYLRKAGLDKDEQDVWRSRYMEVASPEGRSAVALEMEDFAIQRLADEHGLTRAELDAVMKKVNKGRGTAQQVMASRAYDGEGRSLLSWVDDETGVAHEYPLWATQTANVLPLGDMEKAREALTAMGKFKRDHPSTQIPTEMLDTFTRYWKPSVLLRPGWPIRVVTDEQMRIMAKVGVLAQLKNLGPGIANAAGNANARRAAIATRGIDEATGEMMTPQKAASLAPQQKIGFGKEKIRDYEIESVFGDDINNPNHVFELTRSKPQFARLFTDVEKQELDQMQELTKNYHSVSPVENPNEYGAAWLNAVNRQIGQDPLGRILLKGGTYDDAMKWLHSAEGREHLRRLPERRKDLDKFVRAAQGQVDSYALGDPTIMKNALNGRARMDDLIRIAPDASQRPIVHGGVLDDAFGKGIVSTIFGGAIEKAYTALGSIPSDTISRHPFADHMYRAEATRLIGLLDSQAKREGRTLTFQDLELVKKRSREYAISETRKLLYDLSEQSDMAGTLRFISPFYSAWQEVMTRWAGLAVENPPYVARMAQVWHAPERAGIITDENGNAVTTQETGEKIRYPDGTIGTVGKERYVTMSVPSWAKDVIGLDGARTQGKVKFNKKSFNMILQGNPGFGVPVQIPVNEIVKNRPELAESVKMVLPFGPNQNSILQAVMPAAVKRVQSRQLGEEDDVFRNAALRIYNDKLVDYNLGKRETKPTWDEAIKDTKSFYAMRAVASYVLPAAPGFQSPYQPWMDAHRRLRAENIQTADQRFIDMYGEEFFAITQSFSKSADGVPPTVEGWTARSKYKDLIESNPELGGFIIGEEGAGEYANAIYQAQKANKVAPGSTVNQRYALDFEEVAAGPNTRLGWLEYRKVSDLIDSEMFTRGLPNLQVKAAQDLAMAKKLLVAELAQKYPEWYAAFGVVDRNAQERRLVAMRAIAYDPRMKDRPEMGGVREYFDTRALMKAELEKRDANGGSGALDASSNQDLAMIWRTLTAQMVEKNLAFGDTYYRYLERDDLSAA